MFEVTLGIASQTLIHDREIMGSIPGHRQLFFMGEAILNWASAMHVENINLHCLFRDKNLMLVATSSGQIKPFLSITNTSAITTGHPIIVT